MKFIISSLSLVLIFNFFLFGCNEKRDYFEKSDFYQKEDISFPIESKFFSSRYFKFCNNCKNYYYLFVVSKKMCRYSITGNLVDSINLNNLDKIDDYYVLNIDSIYLSIENQNKVLLINSKGITLNEYNLGSNNQGKSFFTYNYRDFPIVVRKNLLYTYHYLEDETSKENLPNYFANPRELVFNLVDSAKLHHKIGRFPSNYRLENYAEMNPKRTFGHNNNILYSFEASDSIFVYNDQGELIKKLDLNTKFFRKNHQIDESKIPRDKYFEETTRYLVENDRFVNLVFNDHSKYYLRTLKLGQPYKNGDGTKNQVEDCQWLLLVYNENFDLIKQLEFPRSKYAVYSMILTNENNLLIPYLNNTNETLFSVFNID